MSVEDRLRRGLEANAGAFVPEAEARLVAVRRRHQARARMFAAATVAAVVVVVATLAGSLMRATDGDRATEPVRQPSRPATSPQAYSGPRIPDSNWRKVITRAEFVDAGASPRFLADNFGSADRVPTTLSFVGSVYSQSSRALGTWSVGDAGTLTYDTQGHLVLTSTAPGCRGCVMRLNWKIDGTRLTLSGFHGTPDDPMARLILEGVWTRIDS
jgi:hypothetical protein